MSSSSVTSTAAAGGGSSLPRYSQLRAKAVHNAYQRMEGLFDQLVYHHARVLELDIHPAKGAWPTLPGDWYVYHDAGDGQTSCHRLSDCLDAVQSFHRAVPDHEVVTLVLDLKAELAGVGHSPADLDARLSKHFDAETLFTPLKLFSACPGATTLRDAVTGCAWPRVDELRGKILVVLTGGSSCVSGGPMGYIQGGVDALERKAFVAPEITSDCAWSKLDGTTSAVFANMSYALRSNALQAFAAGLVSRVWSANDAAAWDSLVSVKTHLLATDKVNAEVDPWARTHSIGGWPFACIEGSCDVPPSEAMPIVRVDIRSGDIWGKADGFYFLSRPFDTKARTWRAFVSVASSHVEEWAKGCIMARASLDADSPYAAVCRPADKHPIRLQYRASKGADSVAKEVTIPPADTLDAEDAPFVRLDVAEGATTVTAYGSADGTTWVKLGAFSFPEPLLLQGLAASGHGSANAVSFLFGKVAVSSGVPSTPLQLADFTSKVAIGDCSYHVASDGTGD